MEITLPLGKLNNKLLAKLIKKIRFEDANLVLPPGVGLDAAGVKIGDKLYAITTDPITLTTDKIGTYSISVNINDIACLGCKPLWYSATLLLPPNITEQKLEAIWNDLVTAASRFSVQLIGGHTEVTNCVNTPVIIGQMIGEAIQNHLLNSTLCQPGQKILLWQKIAIEGTALLATELADELADQFSNQEIKIMQNLLTDPGICVWPFVEQLLPNNDIIALHDPTEGGVATALHELADASGCGLKIDGDNISILNTTKKLAKILQFDPLGLLASGSLLIVCKKEAASKLLTKFKNEPLAIIGELTANQERRITIGNEEKDLPRYDRDEVITALKKDCGLWIEN